MRLLIELGRILLDPDAKTLHVLRYLEDDEYRGGSTASSTGERLHALRRFLFFAHKGHV